jgi:hypothetical protein
VADGAQHSQPVSEGDADILEVLIGQLRQDVGVDLVLPKQVVVLIKAETAEPGPDIHFQLSLLLPNTTA